MKFTAEDIIKMKKPEELFSGNLDAAKKEYRELARIWHPDVSKFSDAASVFSNINALYAKAVEKIEGGFWESLGRLKLKSKTDSTTIDLPYLSRRPFELGEMFVAKNSVLYLIDERHKALMLNGMGHITSFKYGSDRMKTEMERYLPGPMSNYMQCDDGRFAVSIEKKPGLVLLRDVLDFYGGAMDPKHIAWIMSGALNISCYLSFAKIAHCDISLDTYFISPVDHSCALLGGWWYSTKLGEQVRQVPTNTFNHLPWKVKTSKTALPQIDGELIRAMGRELAGGKPVPKALESWLRVSAGGNAFKEYENWGGVLKESFGPRRFTIMEVTPEALYGRK